MEKILAGMEWNEHGLFQGYRHQQVWNCGVDDCLKLHVKKIKKVTLFSEVSAVRGVWRCEKGLRDAKGSVKTRAGSQFDNEYERCVGFVFLVAPNEA